MNYFRHLIESKGRTNLLGRLAMVCQRFDATGAKSMRALERIVGITAGYGCRPSFFITADLLCPNGALTRFITENEVAPGLHGNHHIDYSPLGGKAQRDEIRTGVERFRRLGIKARGFRAPFLRSNGETAKAASDNDLAWTSNGAILFDKNARLCADQGNNGAYNLLEVFYNHRRQTREPSLPVLRSRSFDIPVSLPDDEMLVDRMMIRDVETLSEIWLDMLGTSRRDGELFNYLCHPERIDFVSKPLEKILETANGLGDVWIAPLEDIAGWWQKRSGFRFGVEKEGRDAYRIKNEAADRSSIALLLPGGGEESIGPRAGGGEVFSIRTPWKPCIGVSKDFCAGSMECLQQDGFAVEHYSDPSAYAVVLNGDHGGLSSRQLRLVVERQARGPLLRLRRWPDGFHSALAVTVDIDALNLWDFVRRAYYFFTTKPAMGRYAGKP